MTHLVLAIALLGAPTDDRSGGGGSTAAGSISSSPTAMYDGTACTNIALYVDGDSDTGITDDGTNAMAVCTGGTKTSFSATALTLPAGGALTNSGRSQLKSSADGYYELYNAAGTGFTGLRFGGTSASFPMWKRNGTALNARLADDSGDAGLTCGGITPSGTVLGAAGSASLPEYSYSGDPNTGSYSVGADDWGVSTGGTLRLDVSTTAATCTLPFLGAAGSAGAPEYSYSGDTNTGSYSVGADDWGVSAGGTLRVDVSTTAVTSTLPVLGAAGSASAPEYSYSGDTNTGTYSVGADDWGVSTGGTLRLDVSTTAVTSTLPALGAAGSAGAPEYSYSGDTNTGSYSVGADDWGVSAGGTLRLDVSTTGVTSTLPVRGAAGSASAPEYSYSGDTNTGSYSVGADDWGVATNGALRFDVSTTALTSTLPVLIPDGSATAPSIAFSSSNDGTGTGYYLSTTDTIGIAGNGLQAGTWTSSGSGGLSIRPAASSSALFQLGTSGSQQLLFNSTANTLSGIFTFTTTGVATVQGVVENGITDGTMTNNVSANQGRVKDVMHSYSWTNAMVTALGGTTAGDITVATLPAKALVVRVLVVINTACAGTTTLTVAVGRTSASYIDYVVASDAKAAANTVYGDAKDGSETGTNLFDATAKWVDDLPSWTATTDVKAHFVSTGANLSAVTTCTGTVYIETASPF